MSEKEYVIKLDELDEELDNVLHLYVYGKDAASVADERLLSIEKQLRRMKNEFAKQL